MHLCHLTWLGGAGGPIAGDTHLSLVYINSPALSFLFYLFLCLLVPLGHLPPFQFLLCLVCFSVTHV